MFKKLFRKKAPPAATSRPEISNLERWVQSGQPLQWAAEHNFQWNHDDWSELLSSLQSSEFWPLDAEQVGTVLERLKAEHAAQSAVPV